jgi:hypothetical protein
VHHRSTILEYSGDTILEYPADPILEYPADPRPVVVEL